MTAKSAMVNACHNCYFEDDCAYDPIKKGWCQFHCHKMMPVDDRERCRQKLTDDGHIKGVNDETTD